VEGNDRQIRVMTGRSTALTNLEFRQLPAWLFMSRCGMRCRPLSPGPRWSVDEDGTRPRGSGSPRPETPCSCRRANPSEWQGNRAHKACRKALWTGRRPLAFDRRPRHKAATRNERESPSAHRFPVRPQSTVLPA